jgi:hypothetical protein
MFSLNEILVILGAHYLAGFVCQTHWQAANKSKNNLALIRHASTYGLVLAIVSFSLLGVIGPVWALLNVTLHLITDYFTSRINAKLWAAKDYHYFFCGIGADGLFHHVCLFGTFILFK